MILQKYRGLRPAGNAAALPGRNLSLQVSTDLIKAVLMVIFPMTAVSLPVTANGQSTNASSPRTQKQCMIWDYYTERTWTTPAMDLSSDEEENWRKNVENFLKTDPEFVKALDKFKGIRGSDHKWQGGCSATIRSIGYVQKGHDQFYNDYVTTYYGIEEVLPNWRSFLQSSAASKETATIPAPTVPSAPFRGGIVVGGSNDPVPKTQSSTPRRAVKPSSPSPNKPPAAQLKKKWTGCGRKGQPHCKGSQQ